MNYLKTIFNVLTISFIFTLLMLPGVSSAGGICDINPDGTYIDAEDFTGTIAQGAGPLSVDTAQGGYFGTGYLDSPGTGGSGSCPAVSEGKEYEVNFPEPGIYTVWIRAYASDGSSDSLFIGVDGTCAGSLNSKGVYGQWIWTKSIKTGVNTINVDSAGLHKINIWIRESGFKIDGIYVTAGSETPTDSSIDPFCFGQLMINEVFHDLDSIPNTLTIIGENFDNGDAPAVACGGAAAPYTATNCLLTGSDRIDCLMPEGILIPGDYNLMVSTGGHSMQYDEYDLTIGAVGPAGPQGLQGDKGDKGDPGSLQLVNKKCPSGEALIGFDSNSEPLCHTLADYDGDGYTVAEGDCEDTKSYVNPEATWSSQRYRSQDGSLTLDRNCDGTEEKRWPALYANGAWPDACTSGWGKGTIPACGQRGQWTDRKRCGIINTSCCVDDKDGDGLMEWQYQECR